MTQRRGVPSCRAPLFTAADDERMLAAVHCELEFGGWRYVGDWKHIVAGAIFSEEELAVARAYGGNKQPLVEFHERRGHKPTAQLLRDLKLVRVNSKSSGPPPNRHVLDRSKTYRAALELPAIQQILREHCGDGSRERAIPFAARRHGITEDELRNFLRSRHRPKPVQWFRLGPPRFLPPTAN
jgi:hypothetical protein